MDIEDFLFYMIYLPFAGAVVVYIVTGGEFGLRTMIESAFLPWWLTLAKVTLLLAIVFIALAKLDLTEYI